MTGRDWTWRCEDAAGRELAGLAGAFPTQAEAEAWLADDWESLAERGATQVTLLEGERVVYGPMSLAP